MSASEPWDYDPWWFEPPEPDPDDYETCITDADDLYARGNYDEDGTE